VARLTAGHAAHATKADQLCFYSVRQDLAVTMINEHEAHSKEPHLAERSVVGAN